MRATGAVPSYNIRLSDYNSDRWRPTRSSGHRSRGSLIMEVLLLATGRRAHMTAATNGTATERSVGQPSSERITVALIPKAVADLQHLQEGTGLSKTDLVNRAISLYRFIEE